MNRRIAMGASLALVLLLGSAWAAEALKSGPQPGDDMTPYERLLGDAMEGESLLFARQDGVEEAWRVVDPVLTNHEHVHMYEQKTWGPDEADALLPAGDFWHNPDP